MREHPKIFAEKFQESESNQNDFGYGKRLYIIKKLLLADKLLQE